MTNEMHGLLIAALVGLAAGADASIWGMYKDAAHEGFWWSRFVRSILLAVMSAMVLQRQLHLDMQNAGVLLVLFGLSYATERAIVEGWKTFIRAEDQSKYAIPMQFAIGGVPVRSRVVRAAVGVACLAVLAATVWVVMRIIGTGGSWLHAGGVGFLVGLVIALGGAWKDAPIEGFERLKFFRSPALTTAFALLLFPLTSSVMLSAIAAIGFERAASENYKTFFFPSRPRGKFVGKPVTHPEMLRRRYHFVPAYVGIRLALLWLVVLA